MTVENHDGGDRANHEPLLGGEMDDRRSASRSKATMPLEQEELLEIDSTSSHQNSIYNGKKQINGTGKIEKEKNDLRNQLFNEAKLLLNIALPTVSVMICNMLLWNETASSVGRYDSNNSKNGNLLAGFALASLTTNLSCQSVFVGILSASDTLSPQAFGAGNYREVGLIAIRSYVSTLILLLPLMVVLWYSEAVLILLGQDVHVAAMASQWVRLYIVGIPILLLYNVIQRFLTSQEVVMPLAYSGFLVCLVVHPLALHIFVDRLWGYRGSAVALAFSQSVLSLLLILYMRKWRPHHEGTWPGLSAIFEALDFKSTLAFLSLGTGGLLALSEWWFWEALCFLVGTFGVIPLSVHTIAYQIVPLLFMLPLGISIGLSVRLGSILSTTDLVRAKRLVVGCLVFCIMIALVVALIVYFSRRWIVLIFTEDEKIIQGCKDIWHHVALFVFFDAVYAINSGILRALGLQWRCGIVVFICLWCIGIPLIYHLSVTKGGGLEVLWSTMIPLYIVLNTALAGCYIFADWGKISDIIREREGVNGNPMDIEASSTILAVSDTSSSPTGYGSVTKFEEYQVLNTSGGGVEKVER